MGLFRKKSDPISERARVLNEEIASLEAQIKKLSTQETKPGTPQTKPAPQTNHHLETHPPASVTSPAAQPRLRSTTMPNHRHSQGSAKAVAPGPHEPGYEVADHNPTRPQQPPSLAPETDHDLGVRKYDLRASWRRLKNHFRGPPTSNPKLVNYLAAGSIQGLRPLRYERRVARNRFIVLVVFLVLVLWGLIAFFMRHR